MQMMKRLGLASSLLFGLSSVAFSQSFPEIDFSSRPSYIPNNVVSLTFDDSPDWDNTARVLDVLKQKNVKATFFLNGENWASLSLDIPMQELVRRMVAEGHTVANHTSQHLHLGSLTVEDLNFEISNVEDSVRSILGHNSPKLTLVRAPFGEPYQEKDTTGNLSEDYRRVAPVVARHGVHIGWNIDSLDYNCGDGRCVFENVASQLQRPGQGNYGIILLHSVHQQTVDALPALIDYIKNNGFTIWSVEDVVKARFGKTSAQLVGTSTQPTNPSRPQACDAPAWVQGQWYEIGDVVTFEGQVFTAQNERNPGYHPKISYWFWKAGPMCR